MDKNNEKFDNDENIEHNDDIEIEDVDEDAHALSSTKKLREKLKKCEEEKREYLDGWQRSQADFINWKRSSEESRVTALRNAKENILLSVIPVLDSFDMAFSDAGAHEHIDKNWVAGMQGIQSQLLSILQEHGVSQTNPLGEAFDPNLHDSVSSQEVEKAEDDGKILQVMQKGYVTDDGKPLRAAKVVIGHFPNE